MDLSRIDPMEEIQNDKSKTYDNLYMLCHVL